LENTKNFDSFERKIRPIEIKLNEDIYKLKLEKTKGDSIFSSINKESISRGNSISINMNQIAAYNSSKTLIPNASIYERNVIKNMTDCLFRYTWKYRNTIAAKAIVLTLFFYQLNRWNEYRKYMKVKRFQSQAMNLRNNSSMIFTSLITASVLTLI
jgi:hypothetical protein